MNKNQKKYLVGLCHQLKPVVMVGQKGLTDSVVAEIELALDQHELIKVRVRADRESRTTCFDDISSRCNAELVQKIGQVGCFFRRNTEKPKLELPRG
jgi:RNA-binding protein